MFYYVKMSLDYTYVETLNRFSFRIECNIN